MRGEFAELSKGEELLKGLDKLDVFGNNINETECRVTREAI
jgi:hypothetical protein